jgi:hypothetical protein
MLCLLETATTTAMTTALCCGATTDVAYYEPMRMAQPSNMSDRMILQATQSMTTRAELPTT